MPSPSKPNKTANTRTTGSTGKSAKTGRTAGATAGSAQKKRRRTIAAASVTLVAALVLGTFALSLDGEGKGGGASEAGSDPATVSEPSANPEQDRALMALARRDKADPLAMGRADAPVVMIEYSDFQCPYCGRFARETKPELVKRYVDKGVLRIEWRNFPLFGKESDQAALAGWAAGEQKKFWPFHDELYAEPRKRNSGAFSEDKLVAMADKAGVADLEKFRADLASADAMAAMSKDQEEGYGLGVSSTPAFLINGTPILGAQPTSAFTQAVENAAQKAKTAKAPKTGEKSEGKPEAKPEKDTDGQGAPEGSQGE